MLAQQYTAHLSRPALLKVHPHLCSRADMHTGGFELYCPGKQTERHVGQRYLLWLCFSVWLSTLSRRGKSPERRFTGDLTLHCQRKESRCQRGPLTDERGSTCSFSYLQNDSPPRSGVPDPPHSNWWAVQPRPSTWSPWRRSSLASPSEMEKDLASSCPCLSE